MKRIIIPLAYTLYATPLCFAALHNPSNTHPSTSLNVDDNPYELLASHDSNPPTKRHASRILVSGYIRAQHTTPYNETPPQELRNLVWEYYHDPYVKKVSITKWETTPHYYDEDMLIYVNADKKLALLNLKNTPLSKTFEGYTHLFKKITALVYDKKSNSLFSGDCNGRIIAWHWQALTPNKQYTVELQQMIDKIIPYSHINRLAAVSCGTVTLFNMATKAVVNSFQYETGLAADIEGNRLFYVKEDEIKIFDVKENREGSSLTLNGKRVGSLIYSTEMLFTGHWNNTAIVWDLKSGQPKQTLKINGSGIINSLSFHPPTQRVMITNVDAHNMFTCTNPHEHANNILCLWKLGRNKALHTISFGKMFVRITAYNVITMREEIVPPCKQANKVDLYILDMRRAPLDDVKV